LSLINYVKKKRIGKLFLINPHMFTDITPQKNSSNTLNH